MDTQLLVEVKKNPLYKFIMDVDLIKHEITNGLEKTYTFHRSPNYTNHFKEYPGMNDDIKYINHNKYLTLYPEYEFLYGPYVDSNSEEFNIVYVLHRKEHTLNNIKVIYGSRLLKELSTNTRLDDNLPSENYDWYQNQIKKFNIVNSDCLHAYNTNYKLTDIEKLMIKKIYNATSVSNPKYNKVRNLYNLSICTPDAERSLCVNLGRVLYEIHIAKRRLLPTEAVSVKNGMMGDIRLDNLLYINREDDTLELKKKAWDEFKLDVDKLEKIYSETGFSRFRGIYINNHKSSKECSYGRRYVKLVKPGTDIQYTMYLATALMAVHLNRVLQEDETVDHVNRNKTDDRIENLRILPRTSHSADDAVRVEITPVNCPVCNRVFRMTGKQLAYNKASKSPVCCTPKCTKKLQEIRRTNRTDKLYPQTIDYRYYVLNKITREREYFDSKDYKECRKLLNTTSRS